MPSFRIIESPSRLTVRQHSDPAARLFGLPFLAIGAYFLYQLLGALYDYVQSGTAAFFWANLPGTLLLVLVLLAFAVPGVLLVLFAKETTIDLEKRQVTEMVDFWLFKQRKVHPVELFTKVIAREDRNVTKRKNSFTLKTTYVYPVALATDTTPEVIATVSSSEEEAETIALKLSAFISLPYENNMNKDTP